MSWFLVIPLGVVTFLFATIAFDVLHYLLHRFARSRWALLRWLGGLHQTHHDFLDRNLDIHHDKVAGNLRRHVIPEFVTQFLVTAAFLPVLPAAVVYVAWGIEVLVFLLILRLKGFDVNHRQLDELKAFRPLYFCVPEYHYLHHVFPDAHFSSWIKTLDHLLGSGLSLSGRSVAILGKSDLASALAGRLRQEGADVNLLEHWQGGEGENADVLVLGASRLHGYEDSVQAFLAAPRATAAPPEIWGLQEGVAGSADEELLLPGLYASERVNYRHILCDGRGLAKVSRIVAGLKRGDSIIRVGQSVRT